MLSLSSEQTQKIASDLAKKIRGGSVIALYGDLGSGKTTFVHGLVEGLGIKCRVQSPSFVLVRIYQTKGKKLKVVHVDLYRLKTPAEAKDLGLEEFLDDINTVTVIEWPEKVEAILPKNTVRVYFKYLSENERELVFV